MGKVLVVFASQTGNTEMITDILEEDLQQLGHEVIVKTFDFDVINVDTLSNYDALLVGTYTWDDGEFPYEVEDFYIDLEDVDLTGLVCGVYGSADSLYDTYGLAIDLMADRLQNLGATMAVSPLKIDLAPNKTDEEKCKEFSIAITKVLQTEKKTA